MPCYNAAATVGAAVASIAENDDFAWELVAVDDGSTDGTLAILHNLAAQDARIRVIAAPHGGIVAALEAGFAVCRAPLVARLDADDRNMPGRLQAQAKWLDEHPECVLVGGQVTFGHADAGNEGYRLFVEWINGVRTAEDLSLLRFVESPFAHPSVCFRAAAVRAAGGYRSGDFPEDYELWLRLWDLGHSLGKMDRLLVEWNDSPGRLSRTDTRYRPEVFYRIKAYYLAREWFRRCEKGEQRAIWVWGAGRTTRRRVEALIAQGISVSGYIDVDPAKCGKIHEGAPVVHYTAMPGSTQAFVLVYVGNRGMRERISAELERQGFVPGKDYLVCA